MNWLQWIIHFSYQAFKAIGQSGLLDYWSIGAFRLKRCVADGVRKPGSGTPRCTWWKRSDGTQESVCICPYWIWGASRSQRADTAGNEKTAATSFLGWVAVKKKPNSTGPALFRTYAIICIIIPEAIVNWYLIDWYWTSSLNNYEISTNSVRLIHELMHDSSIH